MTRKRNPYVEEKKALEKEAGLLRDLRPFEKDDLEGVLRTEQGRRFYYRLVFELGDIEGVSFTGSIKDGVAAFGHTAYNEGIRAFAHQLMDEATRHYPDLWEKMLVERIARRQRESIISKQENLNG